jgi:hypothetical protein
MIIEKNVWWLRTPGICWLLYDLLALVFVVALEIHNASHAHVPPTLSLMLFEE